MEALSRLEYPAMLTSLQPGQAVNIFNERARQITKTNQDIADWLEERRKIEEIYVQGLAKLARKQPPDNQSELGIFTTPWQKIITSTETIAQSHRTFASRLEKDAISVLNNFATKNKDMQAMGTIQGNLIAMAKELEDAQSKTEKLGKKGGKPNSAKLGNASQRLETALQEWDSQAPFIFEKLQAVDETRLNHLRDVLTQFQTHEADQVERLRLNAESTLNSLLEVETSVEIINFATNATRGNARLERNSSDRRTSTLANTTPTAATPLSANRGGADDGLSMHSGRHDGSSDRKDVGQPKESKSGLKRLGTMLGRRRQSVQGSSSSTRPASPTKGLGVFNRNIPSRDGRPSPSPRPSSTNLRDLSNKDSRLTPLTESALSSSNEATVEAPNASTNKDMQITNGGNATLVDQAVNGTDRAVSPDIYGVETPLDPPPSQLNTGGKPQVDADGFTVRTAAMDPISMAQQEAVAGTEADQTGFKVDIKNEPIREEDADTQAAISNVANTLRTSTLVAPSRKAGTVRGRRDVRNSMFIPGPEASEGRNIETVLPSTPALTTAASGSRASTLATMASDRGSSDSQSIRSAYSVASNVGSKHPELAGPGLQSSIVETVNATFENGEVKTVTVIGELAMVHGYDQSNAMASSETSTIRLTNFANLEAIAPNHAFVSEVSSDRRGEYLVDLSQLAKTTVAFRYKVHIDQATIAAHAPVLVKIAWRPQGDKLGFVVEYSLNPAFASSPIVLHNFVLVAGYEGGRAAGCQTKPPCTHLKEKSLMYWRLGNITIDVVPQKVIGRLVGTSNLELKPGIIEARWEYPSETWTGSGLGVARLQLSKGKDKMVDPFADDDGPTDAGTSAGENWFAVESARKIISGRYEAR